MSTKNEVTAKCVDVMKNVNGDVFVLGSFTNIDRVNAIAKARALSGRTFAQDLFTAYIMDAVGCEGAISNSAIK